MTTIPGHNQILPQSTIVQEISQQTNASKPGPDQAAAIQQAQQAVQNSSVQQSQESERPKQEKEQREKQKRKTRREREAEARKKKLEKEELALDPEATGLLLDTKA